LGYGLPEFQYPPIALLDVERLSPRSARAPDQAHALVLAASPRWTSAIASCQIRYLALCKSRNIHSSVIQPGSGHCPGVATPEAPRPHLQQVCVFQNGCLSERGNDLHSRQNTARKILRGLLLRGNKTASAQLIKQKDDLRQPGHWRHVLSPNRCEAEGTGPAQFILLFTRDRLPDLVWRFPAGLGIPGHCNHSLPYLRW
jgi:hypothetical protein